MLLTLGVLYRYCMFLSRGRGNSDARVLSFERAECCAFPSLDLHVEATKSVHSERGNRKDMSTTELRQRWKTHSKPLLLP